MSEEIKTEPSGSSPTEWAGEEMHIHKPKAPHGLREFAAEIGVIVVGILIALGLEQGLETLHQRHAAEEAREGIRAELALDIGQMVVRSRSDDCVKARLSDIEGLIDNWSATNPIRMPLWLGRPTTWEISFSRYQAASSNGRTAYFPAEEQAVYSAVYAHIRTFLEAQERERPAWARLQMLEASPRYNPALQSELLLALQEAKYDRARAASAIRQTLRDARRLNIEPNTAGPLRVMGTAPACIPIHTERAAALDLFYGKGDRSADP
jgi:hypothetical protein